MWPEAAGRKVILFFGRLNFKKGLDILTRAFGQLARKREDIVLVIAGPDTEGYGAKVRGWLEDEGVRNRTIFTGMLTGARKNAVLAGATVFVLPSYSENFGICRGRGDGRGSASGDFEACEHLPGSSRRGGGAGGGH
jgi:glycosyltransferase involved in cell wall biosynthesis